MIGRLFYLMIVGVLLFTVDGLGQNTWVKTYGGTNHDIGESIISSGDGNYVFTGKSGSIDKDFQGMTKGGEDICVVKIDNLGNIIWKKIFGGWLTPLL